MQPVHKKTPGNPITEMAIVDTFTRLIFSEDDFARTELSIIRAFRAVEPNVRHDTLHEMGSYLRQLGVREMIALVAHVSQHLGGAIDPLAAAASNTPRVERQQRPR
jgi:hypothetical protein